MIEVGLWGSEVESLNLPGERAKAGVSKLEARERYEKGISLY